MKKFGSLSREVTITISGELGSGKEVLAAFLAKQLESFGAKIDFDLLTHNELSKESVDSAWENTKKFVTEKGSDIHFTDKIIHVRVEY